SHSLSQSGWQARRDRYNLRCPQGENRMARILIVDDSPSQLMGIRRIVEKLGHEAVTAEDGAAGVRAAQEHLPDLILMDVVMPNLNGFQATRTIKRDAATGHIPVILVTTKDQETDRKASCRERVEISEVGASIKKNAEKE